MCLHEIRLLPPNQDSERKGVQTIKSNLTNILREINDNNIRKGMQKIKSRFNFCQDSDSEEEKIPWTIKSVTFIPGPSWRLLNKLESPFLLLDILPHLTPCKEL